jgi:hypothetical protein
MFDSLVAALKALFASLLALFAGASSTGVSLDIPSAQGSIQEIEVGDGPAWGTLSGLTAHPTDPRRLFAVTDQDSKPTRIIEIELTPQSAVAIRQIAVTGPGDEDLDVEGIVAKQDGGYWLASEGGPGNVPANRLLEVDPTGRIVRTIGLPPSIAERMGKKGLEGVALDRTATGTRLAVAFQAPLDDDPPDCTRIGLVDPATGTWSFFLYPLDRNGAGDLTGLSEILHIRDRTYAAIERDGKGGKRSIKWITTFDLAPGAGADPESRPPLLVKRRVRDLVPLFLAEDRKVEKEVEGLAMAADGEIYAVTDNDNERATVLLRLGSVDDLLRAD